MSLLVVPSPTLVFSGDEASLSLHNLTAAAMAFRVVPSAADALEIAPASGVLAAAQSVRVALRRTTAAGVPHALYVRTIPAPADGASAADAWAAAGDRVEEHALTCEAPVADDNGRDASPGRSLVDALGAAAGASSRELRERLDAAERLAVLRSVQLADANARLERLDASSVVDAVRMPPPPQAPPPPPDVAARIATARATARRWPLLSHLAVAILAAWAAGGASSPPPPCPEAGAAPPARVRFGVGPLTLAWR
jgi:hypothetical protein